MAATRLPGKPLLKINDLSIISHVLKKAEETKIGKVIVAAEDQEILDDVKKNGGDGILTSRNHKTGTDRIYEAYKKLDLKNIDYVLNLQGDEPNIDKNDIINLNNLAVGNNFEVGTLAAKINNKQMLYNQNVVKVETEKDLEKYKFSKAIDFSRNNISKQNNNIYHHIGIYLYQVNALEKFVSLTQTKNEIQNKLEQFRAVDNDMKINVTLAKSSPIGVDTQEDYLAIKKIMEYKR
jgi:3-deoxy-manno-octulosonate cytidylyltransferase (CMP-KDO synthetase)